MMDTAPVKTGSWADPGLESGCTDASGIEGTRAELKGRAEVGDDVSTEED